MDNKIKLCIVGSGNIGISMVVDISQNDKYDVTLLTSKANELGVDTCFQKTDIDTSEIKNSKKIFITDDYDKALKNAEIVLITIPTFLIKDFISRLDVYNPKVVLFIPGYGGKEFFCQKLIQKGITIAGFDRSPYIARLTNITSVNASKKKSIRVGCINGNTIEICKILESIFSIKCLPVKNYLTITFTPSNPILHTSRLYSLFKDCTFDTILSKRIFFYAEWDDTSSDMLLKMDKELTKICDSFSNIDLSEVIPNSIHYESYDIKSMTAKISGIKSFQNIEAPMIKTDEGYLIDKNSRYFKEDFLNGLVIIKAFAVISEVNTPHIDMVLKWYEKISNERIFNENNELNYSLLTNIGIPQNYNIKTIKEVEQFYKN